jgi:HPt (histidine-containing phosphotransfer) domain-containing protein
MELIDWDLLMTLKADIGEEDFADVAFVFFSEMQEKLEEIAADPGTAVPDDFHFLKGSAANLGFVAMAEACGMAELACAEGTMPDFPAVRAAFLGALAELRPRLPELAAA